MFALNQRIGTRAIANRLKILNKNKSSATRPGMQTINNLCKLILTDFFAFQCVVIKLFDTCFGKDILDRNESGQEKK